MAFIKVGTSGKGIANGRQDVTTNKSDCRYDVPEDVSAIIINCLATTSGGTSLNPVRVYLEGTFFVELMPADIAELPLNGARLKFDTASGAGQVAITEVR